MSRNLIVVAMISAHGCLAGAANANVLWNFAMTGDTAGDILLIETDGNLVGGSAPAGTYNFINVTLTSTNFTPSLVGTNLLLNPGTGMIWDGLAPTQIFRDFGLYTNGIGFHGPAADGLDDPLWIVDIDYSYVGDYADGDPYANGGLDVQPVPEPAAALLVLPGALVPARRRTAVERRPV